MYRLYWITEEGRAEEEFFETKEERQAREDELKEEGIEYGWEIV